MDNLEKLSTLGTQDEEKKKPHTTQYVPHTTTRKETQTKQIRHEPSYKQLEAKTNWTSFLCGNRNGHHNTELMNLLWSESLLLNHFISYMITSYFINKMMRISNYSFVCCLTCNTAQVERNNTPVGHIILSLNQKVFDLTR